MTRFVVLAALIASTLSAQDWAKQRLEKSPRHREWVKVTAAGRPVDAYVVYPEVSNKAPVVLVIEEIFGLSDWAQLVTDEFAAAGYIAIVPDLLSGKGPNGGGTKSMDSDAIGRGMRDLKPEEITADLNAAADYALKLPSSDGKLFVAGFCFGGSQSFAYATSRPDLKGAFVFYGGAPTDNAALERIKAPVYGFYGGSDARVTATVEPAKKAMAALSKPYEPTVYEGAGHGFMRAGEDPTNKNEANVKARDEAWTAVKAELAKLSK
ncbi:MAG TPA: dienelactone hydrolase family protein [Bryobacteraceae bacterium]|jgi:carboxymethylenebutenolidase|nr:dienelactone hydrolase family protein [Bryobacteraceae bacterium]